MTPFKRLKGVFCPSCHAHAIEGGVMPLHLAVPEFEKLGDKLKLDDGHALGGDEPVFGFACASPGCTFRAAVEPRVFTTADVYDTALHQRVLDNLYMDRVLQGKLTSGRLDAIDDELKAIVETTRKVHKGDEPAAQLIALALRAAVELRAEVVRLHNRLTKIGAAVRGEG